MDRPLTQQAKQLSRTMHNRERRRNAESRPEAGDYDSDRPRKKRSEPLRAAQEAYAAALAAAELQQQQTYQRCELCQASFASEAQLQQHVAGPVHRKAEKKAAEEAAKRQHQSQYGSIAANALQAAAWQDSRSAQALRPDYGQQQQLRKHQQRQKEHQARARGGRQQQQQDSLTHEQVLASVKQADPLSLDGWVPPAVPAAFVEAPAAAAIRDQGVADNSGAKQLQQQPVADHQPHQQSDAGAGLLLPAYDSSSSDGGEFDAAKEPAEPDSTRQQLHQKPCGHEGAAGRASTPGGSDSGDSSEELSPDDASGGRIVSFF